MLICGQIDHLKICLNHLPWRTPCKGRVAGKRVAEEKPTGSWNQSHFVIMKPPPGLLRRPPIAAIPNIAVIVLRALLQTPHYSKIPFNVFGQRKKMGRVLVIYNNLCWWTWQHWQNADADRTDSHCRWPRIIQYICRYMTSSKLLFLMAIIFMHKNCISSLFWFTITEKSSLQGPRSSPVSMEKEH